MSLSSRQEADDEMRHLQEIKSKTIPEIDSSSWPYDAKPYREALVKAVNMDQLNKLLRKQRLSTTTSNAKDKKVQQLLDYLSGE